MVMFAISIVLCAQLMFANQIHSATTGFDERSLKLNSNYSVGISWGHFSSCPGSDKPVIISKKSLKYLTIAVQGPGLPYIAKRVTYNYYQMNKLAKDPNLDFSRRTVMYVGGYNDSPNFIIARMLGKMYNDLNYNVLLLDTNRFTTFVYPRACRNIRAVGKNAAEMIIRLMELGLDPSKLEMVGLSLGGQTMSFIAKNLFNLTGKKVNRLTGLDPAGPCFRHLGPDQRLDSTDADFVDVLFTNIDGFGMAAPIGHVNFYINGGEFQPADFITLPCDILCSHVRVYTIWLSSLLNPDKFVGMKCDSVQQARLHDCYEREPFETNVLGLNVDQNNTGIFYLATESDWPYYLGEKGLKRENMFWNSRLGSYNDEDVVRL